MWEQEIALGITTLSLREFMLACAAVFGVLTFVGTKKSLIDCELEPKSWPLLFGVSGAILSALFVICVIAYQCQHTPVVRPEEHWRNLRVIYHLCLLSLLLMITATDLRNYYILEWTCWLGIVIGIGGAVASGEFQLVHVWIDWNQEQPQLRGPYFPPWLASHQHLHGFVWSLCGIVAGVSLAALTKFISSFILRMPTLGTGDIYLMAMIGAFLGWQPTIIAFAIAPLFALIVGGCVRAVSNRPALPYGPFLALGATATLFTWKWIWMLEVPLAENADRDSIFAVRRFFGDWVSMTVTIGLSVTLFVLLLGMLRFYKSLDLKR
ncbi:prepilin peptidase [Thalassoglobus polymorphus]|uniref:Type IV leader peptidase family protein n=1 Tax=Thalassoglobus polymorphus TaxID=2527994 RepID=A0A517QPD2_9PLAN|nr:A24 family peptidase [Thalassoglobus polymorphus]QDT33483.1 Type IV leader peptidase family protein [Thalassoglobus polymorphus]